VPEVAVNVADVVPADTVTDAGTGSAVVLVEESVTALPPAEAAWFNVAVHVVAAPELMVGGVHASDDTLALGVTVTVAVLLPPNVAVRVTVCGVATEPPVAGNVADVAAAATATEAGTDNAAVLFDASVTTLPPTGAA
jgi:hypothetical protein